MPNNKGSDHIMGYNAADKNDIVERFSQGVIYKTIPVLFLLQDPGFILPSWL